MAPADKVLMTKFNFHRFASADVRMRASLLHGSRFFFSLCMYVENYCFISQFLQWLECIYTWMRNFATPLQQSAGKSQRSSLI
jgi:hypothetical protein